jgi:hypothetical protein
VKPPDNEIRRLLYDICTNPIFEVIILLAILINTIIMAISYEGQNKSYEDKLKTLNLFFSIFFIVECILKLLAYGWKVYWNDQWNKFDFFVVMTSIFDIGMLLMGSKTKALSVTKTFRVLRISRLLRLIK